MIATGLRGEQACGALKRVDPKIVGKHAVDPGHETSNAFAFGYCKARLKLTDPVRARRVWRSMVGGVSRLLLSVNVFTTVVVRSWGLRRRCGRARTLRARRGGMLHVTLI